MLNFIQNYSKYKLLNIFAEAWNDKKLEKALCRCVPWIFSKKNESKEMFRKCRTIPINFWKLQDHCARKIGSIVELVSIPNGAVGCREEGMQHLHHPFLHCQLDWLASPIHRSHCIPQVHFYMHTAHMLREEMFAEPFSSLFWIQ